jgi:hypothetical protein
LGERGESRVVERDVDEFGSHSWKSLAHFAFTRE